MTHNTKNENTPLFAMLQKSLNKTTDLDSSLANIPMVLQDAIDHAKTPRDRTLLSLVKIIGSRIPMARATFTNLREVVESGQSDGTQLSPGELAEAKKFMDKAMDCETFVDNALNRKRGVKVWQASNHGGFANGDDHSVWQLVGYLHQQKLDNELTLSQHNTNGQRIDTKGRFSSELPTFANLSPAQVADYICEAYKLCGPLLKQALRTRMSNSDAMKASTAGMDGWQILEHLQQRSTNADAHAGAKVVASICSVLNCPADIGPIAAADASALIIEKLLREHPAVGDMKPIQMLNLMSLIGILTKCVADANGDKTVVAMIAGELKKQDFYDPDPLDFASTLHKHGVNLKWINQISSGTEQQSKASANHAGHTDQKTQEPTEKWSIVARRNKALATTDDAGGEQRRQKYMANMESQMKRNPAPKASDAHRESAKNVWRTHIPWKRYSKSNIRTKTWTTEMMNHPWAKESSNNSNNSSDHGASMKSTTARISKLEDTTKGIEKNVQAMLALMQAANQ